MDDYDPTHNVAVLWFRFRMRSTVCVSIVERKKRKRRKENTTFSPASVTFLVGDFVFRLEKKVARKGDDVAVER